jgi:hypothetical protein
MFSFEREKEKVELEDKALKSLQELEAEVTRLRRESTAFAEVPTFF